MSMQTESPNIDIEQKIDAYIKGRLNENEAQELWTELLQRPKYIDQLQTEIDLTRYHRQKGEGGHKVKQYWAWFAAIAAVVVVAVGLNILLSESINDYAIEKIILRDNLATSSVMRSGESNYEIVDSLLNLAFENAVSGKTGKALAVYEKIIDRYPSTSSAGKAYLNIGIISYNRGDYTRALTNLKKALPLIEGNHYLLEQVYWYMGNALVRLGEYKQAKEVLQKTYRLNGVHAEQTSELLKRLNQELGIK